MTIDPNLLSVTMHLNELDREAEAMHRAAEGNEDTAKKQTVVARVVEDWKAKVAAFSFSPRPAQ